MEPWVPAEPERYLRESGTRAETLGKGLGSFLHRLSGRRGALNAGVNVSLPEGRRLARRLSSCVHNKIEIPSVLKSGQIIVTAPPSHPACHSVTKGNEIHLRSFVFHKAVWDEYPVPCGLLGVGKWILLIICPVIFQVFSVFPRS